MFDDVFLLHEKGNKANNINSLRFSTKSGGAWQLLIATILLLYVQNKSG